MHTVHTHVYWYIGNDKIKRYILQSALHVLSSHEHMAILLYPVELTHSIDFCWNYANFQDTLGSNVYTQTNVCMCTQECGKGTVNCRVTRILTK